MAKNVRVRKFTGNEPQLSIGYKGGLTIVNSKSTGLKVTVTNQPHGYLVCYYSNEGLDDCEVLPTPQDVNRMVKARLWV